MLIYCIAHSCKLFTVLQQCPSNWQSIFFLLELGLQKCILSLRQATKPQRDSLDMRKFNKIFAPSESTWCFDTKIKSNARKEKKFAFKVAVSQHKICWHFFISWIKPIWSPDTQVKMVSLQSSFSRIYLWNKWLRAG